MSDKWCFFCGVASHNDSECWSTRPFPWVPGYKDYEKYIGHLKQRIAELEKFGLSDRDYAIVEALAEKQGLSVKKLVLQALRLYQRTIDPVDLGVFGCMGFDDEEVDGD